MKAMGIALCKQNEAHSFNEITAAPNLPIEVETNEYKVADICLQT